MKPITSIRKITLEGTNRGYVVRPFSQWRCRSLEIGLEISEAGGYRIRAQFPDRKGEKTVVRHIGMDAGMLSVELAGLKKVLAAREGHPLCVRPLMCGLYILVSGHHSKHGYILRVFIARGLRWEEFRILLIDGELKRLRAFVNEALEECERVIASWPDEVEVEVLS